MPGLKVRTSGCGLPAWQKSDDQTTGSVGWAAAVVTWISCGVPPTSRLHARLEMFLTFICSSTSSLRTCTITVRLISLSRQALGGGPAGAPVVGGALDGLDGLDALAAAEDGGTPSITGLWMVDVAVGLAVVAAVAP